METKHTISDKSSSDASYTPAPNDYDSNFNYQTTLRQIKRTIKTIEKYGPDGEYLGKEVITTDKEDIAESTPIWGCGMTVTSGDTITVSGNGTISDGVAYGISQSNPLLEEE